MKDRYAIADHPTDGTGRQQAKPADAEGTLRAEFLGRLLAAQSELEAQLDALRRAGSEGAAHSLIAACTDQLSSLSALQASLSSAGPGELASLRPAVAATVAASTSAAQQARSGATGAAPESAQLAATGGAVRRELAALNADLFERRIFDPCLTFASKDDEEAYRRREAEARAYIERQLAVGSREGELNAAGATMDRMLDAHAHGADSSAEFLPRWNRLVETTHKHREAMRAEGYSTEEFDRNLASSVRRFLRDKGLSEAEIDAKLAVTANPLEAVKPFLRTEQDARVLDESLNKTNKAAFQSGGTQPYVVPALSTSADDAGSAIGERAAIPVDVIDVMAKFRSAGVAAAPAAVSTEFEHGVGQNQAASPDIGRAPRG